MLQNGPGAMTIKGVLRIPKSSRITGASLSDFFSVISRTLVWGSYPSAEMWSLYSVASADRSNQIGIFEAIQLCIKKNSKCKYKYAMNAIP